jgi:hypothetical protein
LTLQPRMRILLNQAKLHFACFFALAAAIQI